MEINNEHILSDKNYHSESTEKKQIMIMDTQSTGVQHYFGWLSKTHSGYKYTAPYTITKDGVIHEHYDSNYWSKIFNIESIDKGIIPIMLENEGGLTYNAKKKEFINWSGDIYIKDKELVEMKKWRGGFFWSPYTMNQIESLSKLIIMLGDKHNIPLRIRTLDYEDRHVEQYNGVVTKHDYNILSTHINPAFDINELKKRFKEHEKTIN